MERDIVLSSRPGGRPASRHDAAAAETAAAARAADDRSPSRGGRGFAGVAALLAVLRLREAAAPPGEHPDEAARRRAAAACLRRAQDQALEFAARELLGAGLPEYANALATGDLPWPDALPPRTGWRPGEDLVLFDGRSGGDPA